MTQLDIILTVAGTLGIRELIPLLLDRFFKPKEEVLKARLDNSAALESGNREQIQFLKAQLSEAYVEIDKMQDIINKKRSQVVELMGKLTQIELDLIRREGERDRYKMFACLKTSCIARETTAPEK